MYLYYLIAVADDVLPGAGRRVHDHEVPLQLPHLPHHRQYLPAGIILCHMDLYNSV